VYADDVVSLGTGGALGDSEVSVNSPDAHPATTTSAATATHAGVFTPRSSRSALNTSQRRRHYPQKAQSEQTRMNLQRLRPLEAEAMEGPSLEFPVATVRKLGAMQHRSDQQ
jgi:hypothetical protein